MPWEADTEYRKRRFARLFRHGDARERRIKADDDRQQQLRAIAAEMNLASMALDDAKSCEMECDLTRNRARLEAMAGEFRIKAEGHVDIARELFAAMHEVDRHTLPLLDAEPDGIGAITEAPEGGAA